MKEKIITVSFGSMPQLITESFLTNDQVKKLKDTFKDFIVVVRCKDCKHRLECDYWIENGDDWYCADGERRE